MCTLVTKRLNNSWFLAKTRDPVYFMRFEDEIKMFATKADAYKKWIVQNPVPYEDGYYGGINEKGVAFIATYVPVAENQISYIRCPYVRLILDAKNAKAAVKIIRSFSPRIGGNMFVADEKECYEIEGAPDKYVVNKANSPLAKTNHFIHLPYKNVQMKTDPGYLNWTLDRYIRATELIKRSTTVEDLQNILRDRKNADRKNAICTTSKEEKCYTYSAFIFDTKGKKAYYCQGNPLENEFKEYGFT
ncbi:hypothetical protein COY90_03890 [Candidatus Roizmanbacteria bacterium CG_4_10_14_0_8_um_filter_39_9]|uniref:Peptidase C45 hydrolase domain-containing protein n=1 Tax=Candidatus Roizmanbacteria bacterium CG_4_10_14_0_8_um_filter_39_9 TaxID=1974829 RepID=A0A2M7QD21_9BACT|nr:MAG: hypothetical protein COY90_03890 [Candidatus Roizmanbacteria bacterium CG_4_10_14_0_8_um_filter_39_9]